MTATCKHLLPVYVLQILFSLGAVLHAQQTARWSTAMAATVMQRNTGLPGQSLTRWSYWKGYTLDGIEMLWLSTGDDRYLNYIRLQIDPYIGKDGHLVNVSLNGLDGFMSGNIVVGLYEHTRDPRYRQAAEDLRLAMTGFPRNSDGGFWHHKQLDGQMWIDGVFMGQMFLLRYGQSIGDRKECFDEAIKQITVFARHAHKKRTGLYDHAWTANSAASKVVGGHGQTWADPATGLSPEVWSEGLGWYALVTAEALARIPAGYPGREKVLKIYTELAAGLRNYQDAATGGWYVVVDKPKAVGNWIDPSGSAMFVYALERGIEMGILDKRKYAPVVARGYQSITHSARMSSNGEVDVMDGCDGLCVQAGYGDYIRCKRQPNAKEAVASFLWATAIVEKPRAGRY
ncbi:MAG: glycoside hydrolase family 88 protein [Terracidiphilus sp.]|nr:glycoside hydrolase family 88 protein [Terracidiphilus sp.]